MRVKIIGFYTEGPPYDTGIPLTEGMYTYRQIAEDAGLIFDAYTPRRLREMGAGDLVKEYPDEYKLPVNQTMHKIGFSAWKPFIILDAMRDLDEGDIVFYLDSNIGKYPALRKMISNAENVSNIVLDRCDFYVGREIQGQELQVQHFSNKILLEELGKNSDFVKHFPLLICNNIICKKTHFAHSILIDWLTFCRVDRFLYILDQTEPQHPHYRWSCSEQSVLNVVIARHVEEGLLPWFFPGISYGRGYQPILADNSHVKNLTDTVWSPKTTTLRNQFKEYIDNTHLYLKNIYDGKQKEQVPEEIVNISVQDINLIPYDNGENGTLEYEAIECEAIEIKKSDFINSFVRMILDVEIKTNDKIGIHIQDGNIDVATCFPDFSPALSPKAVDIKKISLNEKNAVFEAKFYMNTDTIKLEVRNTMGYFHGHGRSFFKIKEISIGVSHIRPLSRN
ncbi:hypothetical protein [Acetobacter oryzoeni]|uniref:hypothetical protein n=1 Tax=Acetobacter oryzoeni TaxID=2500548 RepID=UPI003DA8FF9D